MGSLLQGSLITGARAGIVFYGDMSANIIFSDNVSQPFGFAGGQRSILFHLQVFSH